MPKNSGRRSAADLAAKTFVSVIVPTRKLSAAEQRVWDRVMQSWPANHWIGSDSDILTDYCSAFVMAGDAARKGDASAMDKAGRLALSYATKLRLTPQSRYDHKGTHTEATRGRENDAADDRLLGGTAVWPEQHDAKPN
jgi:hypothetical protein